MVPSFFTAEGAEDTEDEEGSGEEKRKDGRTLVLLSISIFPLRTSAPSAVKHGVPHAPCAQTYTVTRPRLAAALSRVRFLPMLRPTSP